MLPIALTQATQESEFINLEGEGCSGGSHLAVSSENRHAYVTCGRRSPEVFEVDLDSNQVCACMHACVHVCMGVVH